MDLDRPSRARALTRREVIAWMGSACTVFMAPRTIGSELPAKRATSACIVRPQQTAGPYFVDERLERSDIRSDPERGTLTPGVPLQLVFNVSRLSGADCTPLVGSRVDVWHCDALGVYSDARDPRFNTVGQKFLRGYQLTDAAGTARFTTIYPGWYRGRTVHVHFRVRSESSPGTDFTSQLYFDDLLTDRVHALEPYRRQGPRTVTNEGDGIFLDGGKRLTLAVIEKGDGYLGSLDVALRADPHRGIRDTDWRGRLHQR